MRVLLLASLVAMAVTEAMVLLLLGEDHPDRLLVVSWINHLAYALSFALAWVGINMIEEERDAERQRANEAEMRLRQQREEAISERYANMG